MAQSMPVLVAPAAVAGLRAPVVAAAIGRGLERAGLAPPDLCPVAGGGHGTIEILLPALGGETGDGFALIDDGGTAIVELGPDGRATGARIARAIDAGAAVVLVAAGGSGERGRGAWSGAAAIEASGRADEAAAIEMGGRADEAPAIETGRCADEAAAIEAGGCTDGTAAIEARGRADGAAAIEASGRADGAAAIEASGRADGAAAIEARGRADGATAIEARGCTDGTAAIEASGRADGAAAIEFDGGAGVVEAIEEAGGLRGAVLVVLCETLAAWSARAGSAELRRDPRGVPMTGAGDGLAGALWARYDAQLVAGPAFVLEQLGFDVRMRAARAVVAGEARLDRGTLAGRIAGEVAIRARQAGVPCHAVAARNALDPFDVRVLDLQAIVEAATVEQLEAAGERLAGFL
jgi:glycerate kinase